MSNIPVLTTKQSGYKDYPYSVYLNGVYVDDFTDEPDYKEAIRIRLETIEQAIHEENISYGEIVELQNMVNYIPKDNMLLKQWAGAEE